MIARVFPRKTSATPTDEYAFVGEPPLFLPEGIEEVHVSVVFTWDLPEAERLARAWSRIAPVKIGGPATGMRGEEFTPGMYVKRGYTFTSRGCDSGCWFCSVPKREGKLRELEIHDGNIVTDDNLLACSRKHILEVFEMLKRQKYGRVFFTGGIEAKRLRPWHIDLFKELRPKEIFFAYDTPDDLQPLRVASAMFDRAAYGTRNILYCYTLIGYPGDTFEAAKVRLQAVKGLGFSPFAMLYRDETGVTDKLWRRFQRSWVRPAAIFAKVRDTRYLATTGLSCNRQSGSILEGLANESNI